MTKLKDAMNSHDPITPNSENPYAAPATESFMRGQPGDANEFENIRRSHLNHEASIRSFGFIYYLGGGLLLLMGCGWIGFGLMPTNVQQPNASFAATTVMAGLWVVIGLLQIFVARGMRTLNPIGRIGGSLFGLIGLLFIPVGTLISVYLLYLLLSAKGRFIFSPQYQEVMKATPNIVYKTSKIIVVLAVALLLLLTLGIASLLFG